MTGKFDEITLARLFIAEYTGSDSSAQSVILSDAVNALVETVDVNTRRPLFSRQVIRLIPQPRSNPGMAKLPYVPT